MVINGIFLPILLRFWFDHGTGGFLGGDDFPLPSFARSFFMSCVAPRSPVAGFTLAGGSDTRCMDVPEPLAFLGDSTGVCFCDSTVRRAGSG
jgi:hypothetical protein